MTLAPARRAVLFAFLVAFLAAALAGYIRLRLSPQPPAA